MLMRFVERRSNLHPEIDDLFFWKSPRRQPLSQRDALDILHHQKIHALVGFQSEERLDVGMIQLGQRERVGAKTLPRGLIPQ